MRPPKPIRILAAILMAACIIVAGCASPAPPAPQTSQKLGTAYYPGSLTTLAPNFQFPVMTFTATSQTVTQPLSGQSFCTMEILDATVTTLTLGIDVSNDGGTTWFALPVAPLVGGTLVPTTTAITITSGTQHAYVMNVAGWTNIEGITSSTFTATGVSVQITCTSNGGYIMNIG